MYCTESLIHAYMLCVSFSNLEFKVISLCHFGHGILESKVQPCMWNIRVHPKKYRSWNRRLPLWSAIQF